MVTPNIVFRLTDDDLALLEEIRVFTGVRTRAEALRYALRYWRRHEGRAAVKPKPKPKRKSRRGA
jgi:hypothetical protein